MTYYYLLYSLTIPTESRVEFRAISEAFSALSPTLYDLNTQRPWSEIQYLHFLVSDDEPNIMASMEKYVIPIKLN